MSFISLYVRFSIRKMKSEDCCEGSSTDSDIEQDSSYSKSSKIDFYKPEYTYPQLIVQAILSSPNKQIPLKGIYSYISDKYPYFRKSGKSWQNSIRHNLSINRNFIKVPRKRDDMGLGSLWKLDSKVETKMIEEAFLPRRRLRFLRQPQTVSTKRIQPNLEDQQINKITWDLKTSINDLNSINKNNSNTINHKAYLTSNHYSSNSQRYLKNSNSGSAEDQATSEKLLKNFIQAKCEIEPISPCEDGSRSSSRTESVCSNQLYLSDEDEDLHDDSLEYFRQNVIPIHNFLEVKISETSDSLHDWNILASQKYHENDGGLKTDSTSKLEEKNCDT